MGKSDSDSTIYGSKLTWAVGNVDSTTGEFNPSVTTYISSGFVKVKGGKVLTYTGPDKDENDIAFAVYVGQYDKNYDFISRISLYVPSSHIVTAQLVENCTYIRVQFGHATSTGVNMNVSDGSLFVCTVQDRSEVKNTFVDGSYAKGSSSATLTGNRLSINSFVIGSSNGLLLQFKYPLNIKTGDTLRLLIKKVSGTTSNSFLSADIGGNNVCTNKSWGTGTTTVDATKTSTTSNNTLNLALQLLSSTPKLNGYVATITVYVNGVQVLPEV